MALAIGACANELDDGPSAASPASAWPPAGEVPSARSATQVVAAPQRTASTEPGVSATTPPSPARTLATSPGGAGGVSAPTRGEPGPAPSLEGLVTADGSAFHLADLRARPTLLFFGYSHCPDVCPTTIGELFAVLEAQPDVHAVFVSIDPERDTPAFLASWTQYFPANFHALTGTPGSIRQAADGYGVRFARVETTSTAGYTMSHTADVFLIDPRGRLLQAYPFGTPAETMIADVSQLSTG